MPQYVSLYSLVHDADQLLFDIFPSSHLSMMPAIGYQTPFPFLTCP